MDRHDKNELTTKKKASRREQMEPDFGGFGGLHDANASWWQHPLAQRGTFVALAGALEWKLIDFAQRAWETNGTTEAVRLSMCFFLAVLAVVVFGLAAWFIAKTGVTNAPNKATRRKRSTEP